MLDITNIPNYYKKTSPCRNNVSCTETLVVPCTSKSNRRAMNTVIYLLACNYDIVYMHLQRMGRQMMGFYYKCETIPVCTRVAI